MALRWIILIGIVTLILGFVGGWFAGRVALEKQWGNPWATLGPGDETKAAVKDADPTPKAGTKVLRGVPLLKAREAVGALTKDDPLHVTVGAVGRNDEEVDLHLVVENRGKCKATSYAGVAYGYDAFGRAAKMNKTGEHYIAFTAEKVEVAPGDKDQYEMKLKHPETASLAVAHIDRVTCDNGTTWSRQ